MIRFTLPTFRRAMRKVAMAAAIAAIAIPAGPAFADPVTVSDEQPKGQPDFEYTINTGETGATSDVVITTWYSEEEEGGAHYEADLLLCDTVNDADTDAASCKHRE